MTSELYLNFEKFKSVSSICHWVFLSDKGCDCLSSSESFKIPTVELRDFMFCFVPATWSGGLRITEEWKEKLQGRKWSQLKLILFSPKSWLLWPYTLHGNLLWLQLGVILISHFIHRSELHFGTLQWDQRPPRNSAQLPTFQVASPKIKFFLAETEEH